jgi:4-carboxymuconolactone decarboxylase
VTASPQHSSAFEAGLAVRREVLGAEHVDRSLEQVTEFSRPVQEWVTECGWGAVWTRPGLDRRTRSLLNLVMLTALNRMHEFSVHVRGAVTNGCTDDEIKEALLQAALYCGAPAALESFRVAERVLGEVRAHG